MSICCAIFISISESFSPINIDSRSIFDIFDFRSVFSEFLQQTKEGLAYECSCNTGPLLMLAFGDCERVDGGSADCDIIGEE